MRFIILFTVIILLFNFIIEPKQVEASVALTLGGLALTYEVAQAIYLTAIIAAGVGVTFLTWQEAIKFHDMVEGTSPAPLEYPEWEDAREEVQQSKADLAQEYWFAQWGLEVLPGGQQDPEPGNNNKRGILALLGGAAVIGGFINKFISMFQKLELDEGDNIITESDKFIITDENWTEYLPGTHTFNLNYIRTVSGEMRMYYLESVKDTSYDRHLMFSKGVQINSTGYSSIYPMKLTNEGGTITLYNYQEAFGWATQFIIKNIKYDVITEIPEQTEGLFLKVSSNSPILDIKPYNKFPQPNLIPIPRHNPTTQPLLNPDGTPKPGIQSILNPDGSIEDRFYGDVDDLLEDIVMNTPIDKILNPDGNPGYIIEPGPDHIIITYPDVEPTEPYPQPKPPTRPVIWPPLTPDPETWPENIPYPEWPQPDPLTWPEPYPYPTRPDPWPPLEPIPWPDPDTWPPTVPYPYPDPDTWPPTVPYPFPQPEPNPNPSPIVPVEPGTQIDYTPWLQIIINWLSQIWNKIPNLFSPEPDYLKQKAEQLQIKVNTKLNLPDLTPLPAIFDGIGCEPIPDGYIGDNKVFDASYINNLAPTIANWQRFLWCIVLILIGANNAYKLIRGTDLITIKGPHGRGWSSKGG